MRTLWFFVVVLVTVHATTRQAPGDKSNICVKINEGLRNFVNQKVLMSSLNYHTLFDSNGPWATIDVDGDDPPSVRGEVYTKYFSNY